MALTLTTSGDLDSIVVENKTWVYGFFTFNQAGDTYTTGGISVVPLIKNRFGVTNVEAMFFGNGLSDGSGATFVGTGEAQPRYELSTGKMKLFLIGRTGAPTGAATGANVSETEVVNGASINNGKIEFWAICS